MVAGVSQVGAHSPGPQGHFPGPSHVLPAGGSLDRRFEPSTSAGLILRLVLIGCFCAAMLHALTVPVERNVGDLLTNLSDGNVESMTIERPAAGVQGQMQLRVDWTQTSGRDAYAYYEHSTLPGSSQIDEGATILAAAQSSPSAVDVTVRDGIADRSAISLNLLGLVWFAALLVLIGGARPRLATKWAWFWLGLAIPVLFAVYLVLEPVPVWRRAPMAPSAGKLTGGWAFLLALVLGGLWQSVDPFMA